jgi:hypothetical protein
MGLPNRAEFGKSPQIFRMRTRTTTSLLSAAALGICLFRAAPAQSQTNAPPASAKSAESKSKTDKPKSYIWMAAPGKPKAATDKAAEKRAEPKPAHGSASPAIASPAAPPASKPVAESAAPPVAPPTVRPIASATLKPAPARAAVAPVNADQGKPAAAAPTKNYVWIAAPAKATVTMGSPAVATTKPVAPAPEPARALTPREAKLAELLAVYRADKITPRQYQDQRAKILAE